MKKLKSPDFSEFEVEITEEFVQPLSLLLAPLGVRVEKGSDGKFLVTRVPLWKEKRIKKFLKAFEKLYK
jgi:hypothetical protein